MEVSLWLNKQKTPEHQQQQKDNYNSKRLVSLVGSSMDRGIFLQQETFFLYEKNPSLVKRENY